MQLEVGFAPQQLALVARLQHLAQPLHPIAARKEQQPSEDLRGGRRDVGVVVIEADAEVRVVQRRVELKRALERVLDPLAVPRGAEPLTAKDPPLNPRARTLPPDRTRLQRAAARGGSRLRWRRWWKPRVR